DFAARRGIAFVDLTPSLAEAAQAGLAHGRLVYWRDDTHWNAAGIDVAAAAIAASLPR
ncbi:MAG: hypothetical protein FJX53_16260, partial [Alphaproteobacteria bacterium]|nr:hypothetical protein [Alphaproteobacteria bacterium]